jgi:hypothetical protein
MTVTVHKISKPKPPTNPLAFDPDTQPGELVMVMAAAGELERGGVFTLARYAADKILTEQWTGWLNAAYFINVHYLPDGTLAFGRGPAVPKTEPRVYTTEEVCRSPEGYLFENTDPEDPYTHARVTLNQVIITHRDGRDSLLSAYGLCSPTWRRLATEHNVKIEYEEEACETAENFMRGSLKDQKGNNDEQV